MLARVLSRSSALAARTLPRALAPTGSRALCVGDDKGIQVDMVCRMWSLKVADDETAHEMDCVFDELIDDVSEIEGCAGASRLVCKSEWDYKFILKFEDVSSLENYMANEHERVSAVHLGRIKQLAVDEKVKQQNFVYDDIE